MVGLDERSSHKKDSSTNRLPRSPTLISPSRRSRSSRNVWRRASNSGTLPVLDPDTLQQQPDVLIKGPDGFLIPQGSLIKTDTAQNIDGAVVRDGQYFDPGTRLWRSPDPAERSSGVLEQDALFTVAPDIEDLEERQKRRRKQQKKKQARQEFEISKRYWLVRKVRDICRKNQVMILIVTCIAIISFVLGMSSRGGSAGIGKYEGIAPHSNPHSSANLLTVHHPFSDNTTTKTPYRRVCSIVYSTTVLCVTIRLPWSDTTVNDERYTTYGPHVTFLDDEALQHCRREAASLKLSLQQGQRACIDDLAHELADLAQKQGKLRFDVVGVWSRGKLRAGIAYNKSRISYQDVTDWTWFGLRDPASKLSKRMNAFMRQHVVLVIGGSKTVTDVTHCLIDSLSFGGASCSRPHIPPISRECASGEIEDDGRRQLHEVGSYRDLSPNKTFIGALPGFEPTTVDQGKTRQLPTFSLVDVMRRAGMDLFHDYSPTSAPSVIKPTMVPMTVITPVASPVLTSAPVVLAPVGRDNTPIGGSESKSSSPDSAAPFAKIEASAPGNENNESTAPVVSSNGVSNAPVENENTMESAAPLVAPVQRVDAPIGGGNSAIEIPMAGNSESGVNSNDQFYPHRTQGPSSSPHDENPNDRFYSSEKDGIPRSLQQDNEQQRSLRKLSLIVDYPLSSLTSDFMLRHRWKDVVRLQQTFPLQLLDILSDNSRAQLADMGYDLQNVVVLDGIPQFYPTLTGAGDNGFDLYTTREDFRARVSFFDAWIEDLGSTCRGPLPLETTNKTQTQALQHARQAFTSRPDLFDASKWYGFTWEMGNLFWWQTRAWHLSHGLDCTRSGPQAGLACVHSYVIAAIIDAHYEANEGRL